MEIYYNLLHITILLIYIFFISIRAAISGYYFKFTIFKVFVILQKLQNNKIVKL